MLARRFTIVCLLALIFGMFLSTLVAKTSRPARSWDVGTAVPCVFDEGIRCTAPIRR